MNPFRRKNGQTIISQSVVLDTSGLIDGRIVQIAKAGFVPQNIVVAQFVIAELQFLADHGDSHKRERARYGMDVIRELQEIKRVDVEIARQKFDAIREVDDKLVALAKQMGAMLYTTDFNLNKVAQIEGVTVLNVNELAQALRPNLLPGERVTIKLTQVGQDKSQGVGYLSDGTMVVVEQASRLVGQQVQAVCTRILQTQAGKMMFATLASGANTAHHAGSNKPQAQQPQPPAARHFDPAQSRGNARHQQPAASQVQPQAGPAKKQSTAQATTPRRQPAQSQPEEPQQPQKEKTEKPQQRANTRRRNNSVSRAGGEQHANAKQQEPQQKQSASTQAPRSRSRRRPSPEDSLIATLNEIQK